MATLYNGFSIIYVYTYSLSWVSSVYIQASPSFC